MLQGKQLLASCDMPLQPAELACCSILIRYIVSIPTINTKYSGQCAPDRAAIGAGVVKYACN